MHANSTAQKRPVWLIQITRFISGGSQILLYLAGAALVLMLLLVMLDVVLRTTGWGAVTGSIEYVSQWFLPVIVLFALAATESKGEHIRVSIVEEYLTGSAKRVLGVVAQICISGLSWLLFVFSCVGAQATFAIRESVPMGTGQLEIWPIKMLITIAWLWFALQSLVNLLGEFFPEQAVDANALDEAGEGAR